VAYVIGLGYRIASRTFSAFLSKLKHTTRPHRLIERFNLWNRVQQGQVVWNFLYATALFIVSSSLSSSSIIITANCISSSEYTNNFQHPSLLNRHPLSHTTNFPSISHNNDIIQLGNTTLSSVYGGLPWLGSSWSRGRCETRLWEHSSVWRCSSHWQRHHVADSEHRDGVKRDKTKMNEKICGFLLRNCQWWIGKTDLSSSCLFLPLWFYLLLRKNPVCAQIGASITSSSVVYYPGTNPSALHQRHDIIVLIHGMPKVHFTSCEMCCRTRTADDGLIVRNSLLLDHSNCWFNFPKARNRWEN